MEESHLSFFLTVQTLSAQKLWKGSSLKYKIYAVVYTVLFLYNLLMLQIKLVLAEDLEMVAENLNYTIMYTVMAIATRYLNNPNCRSLLLDIEKFEKTISQKGDTDRRVLEISNKYSKYNNRINRFMFCFTLSTCILLSYSYSHLPFRPKDRLKFIFPEWYFMDIEKYYWLIYIDNTLFVVVCLGPMFVYVRFASLTFTTYINARLEMLQYFIKIVDSLSVKLSEKYDIPIQDARYCILRSCLKQHIYIIK